MYPFLPILLFQLQPSMEGYVDHWLLIGLLGSPTIRYYECETSFVNKSNVIFISTKTLLVILYQYMSYFMSALTILLALYDNGFENTWGSFGTYFILFLITGTRSK